MHDVIIRNGTVIDGSGNKPFVADIAIDNGTITRVDENLRTMEAKRSIDADGLLVTPGFVDIHTHYDGQATWDPMLSPSILHGVTTVVMGNCGVGFAPVKPEQRDWLISLMEGVEDIPGTVLSEGMDWNWETFPEYLNVLDSKPHSIDIAAQLPHGALRTYVMGERGGCHEEQPTADEIEQMAAITNEAITAGALGFTSSRTVNHKTANGEPTPSLTAPAEELLGIAAGLGKTGTGVIQIISDLDDHDAEMDLIKKMAVQSDRPLSISLNQIPEKADEWQQTLAYIQSANEEGLSMRAQVAPRPVGVILSLQSTYHPFVMCPSYHPLMGKPASEQATLLEQDAALREQILKDYEDNGLFELDTTFELGDPPVYEPSPDDAIGARAEREGLGKAELAMQLMCKDGGTGMLYFPALNFHAGNSEASRAMLMDPNSVPGLGDGGAHVSFISDASFCTYLLTHWARDRKDGQIPLEYLVKSQTRDTAETVGLHDRGLLQPGMKADINIINFDVLSVKKPDMINDLPAGGNLPAGGF